MKHTYRLTLYSEAEHIAKREMVITIDSSSVNPEIFNHVRQKSECLEAFLIGDSNSDKLSPKREEPFCAIIK